MVRQTRAGKWREPRSLDAAFIFLMCYADHLEPEDGIISKDLDTIVSLAWSCRVYIAERLTDVVSTHYDELVALGDYNVNIIQQAADEFDRNHRIGPDPWVQSVIDRAPR